jgi:hypothetical protein
MSDVIQVDKDILESQIAKLQGLIQDSELKDYCVQLITPAIARSAGTNVTDLYELHQELDAAIAMFYTLAERTLDLLTNAKTSFIAADQGLAERISTGNI